VIIDRRIKSTKLIRITDTTTMISISSLYAQSTTRSSNSSLHLNLTYHHILYNPPYKAITINPNNKKRQS